MTKEEKLMNEKIQQQTEQEQPKVIEVPVFFSKEDYKKMIYATHINVQELLELVKQQDVVA
jgi:allophanate hydrolase subunit 1